MTMQVNPTWHWPVFKGALCGQMSDRERLGLPDHYVPGRLDQAVAQAMAQVRSESVDGLLARLSNASTPLAERLACGQMLAWLGDPRIQVKQPDMVEVEGGQVAIGLPFDQLDDTMDALEGLGLERSWIEKECPRHTVNLKPFKLARYPVTHAEYRVFLLETGHPELPSSWPFRQFPQACANHPVYTVSAASADAYAHWLARVTQRPFRLPTEAEWEWAASGPAGRTFPWGEHFDADLCNTAETGLFSTSPVGAFVGGESPFGLADMAGNVEEYVADSYQAYPGGTHVSDHLVQIHGQYRVARGGSFARFRDLARTRRRHGHNPKSVTYAMGFRLAEDI